MCGLAINISSFELLLKKVHYDAVVDHLAITHIMKSKVEPAMTGIKRLLELLSSYSFNLNDIKVTFCQDKRWMTVTLMNSFQYHSI